ncbi:MAG: KH domain-containing protein [Candidatus Goldbacteria bacterium]|nr:KH domain-containing protein [Candidatus Goldiibacteriota bacterium]HPD18734.1 R3H domain-containing nucleic acid-binding protein [Candidatus Goldiibacteriota bacterium]
MQTCIRKTAPTISHAVKEFMQENNASLQEVSVCLLKEKVFTNKKEYVLDLSLKNRFTNTVQGINETEIKYAFNILEKIFALMNLKLKMEPVNQNGLVIIKIISEDKDGLIIGKNGKNLSSLQYFLSIALNKKFHRQIPILLDVDSYINKRTIYLKNFAKTLADRVLESKTEVITDLLASYERKIIHEEITTYNLKSFSVGKGPYKKVVITAML